MARIEHIFHLIARREIGAIWRRFMGEYYPRQEHYFHVEPAGQSRQS